METHKNTPYYNLFPAKQGKKEQHWKNNFEAPFWNEIIGL